MKKLKLLFLCTGNAARSQVAEGLAKLDHGDLFDVYSAGSRPAGFVHPMAVRAVADAGGDISDSTSKPASKYANEQFDVVVTVCDSAAQDCPVWPNAKRLDHWSIPDPTDADPREKWQRFIEVRDDLRSRINALAAELEK
jgi:arsenate reductase